MYSLAFRHCLDDLRHRPEGAPVFLASPGHHHGQERQADHPGKRVPYDQNLDRVVPCKGGRQEGQADVFAYLHCNQSRCDCTDFAFNCTFSHGKKSGSEKHISASATQSRLSSMFSHLTASFAVITTHSACIA